MRTHAFRVAACCLATLVLPAPARAAEAPGAADAPAAAEAPAPADTGAPAGPLSLDWENLTGEQRLERADRLMANARAMLDAADPATVATLTVREALYFGMTNNLDIQIQGFQSQLSDADVLAAEGAFDPEIYGRLTQSQRTDPQSTRGSLAAGGTTTIQEDRTTAEGGVRGKIASGAEYTLQGTRDRVDSNLNRAAGITSEYEIDATTNITQPLLRNFGILVNTAPIRIAQTQRAVEDQTFARQVMVSLTDIHDAYWEVVRTREDLLVAIDSLRVARDLLRQNQIRLEVGTMAPLEVLQAETGVASRAETVIVAMQAVRDAEDELKRLLNLPRSTDAWHRAIRPADEPHSTAPSVDLDAAVAEALHDRPDLQAARLTLENNELNVLVARNALLPQLDATAEYGVRGIDPDLQEAYDQAGRTHRENWRLQADFSYPILNRDARGSYRRAELERAQQLYTIADLELRVTAEVRAATRAVETAWQRIQVTQVARRLAEEQLAAEQKKLEVGVSTSFDVLEKEQDLTAARSNEIAARIDYEQSLAALDLAVGRTLDARGISIVAKRD